MSQHHQTQDDTSPAPPSNHATVTTVDGHTGNVVVVTTTTAAPPAAPPPSAAGREAAVFLDAVHEAATLLPAEPPGVGGGGVAVSAGSGGGGGGRPPVPLAPPRSQASSEPTTRIASRGTSPSRSSAPESDAAATDSAFGPSAAATPSRPASSQPPSAPPTPRATAAVDASAGAVAGVASGASVQTAVRVQPLPPTTVTANDSPAAPTFHAEQQRCAGGGAAAQVALTVTLEAKSAAGAANAASATASSRRRCLPPGAPMPHHEPTPVAKCAHTFPVDKCFVPPPPPPPRSEESKKKKKAADAPDRAAQASHADDDGAAVADPPPRNVHIDASQATVFDSIGRPLVDHVFGGGNATVIAFGESGTGKTHTVVGPCKRTAPTALPAPGDRGLLLRGCEHLFRLIALQPPTAAPVVVSVSVCELYNGTTRCLLSPFPTSTVAWVGVRSYAECEEVLERGIRRRVSAAVATHANSSRSHAIFGVRVERGGGEAATLSFVDLAGSERFDAGARSDPRRAGETMWINRSLWALREVIDAASASGGGSKANAALPASLLCRRSPLTMALHESLLGNARTVLLGTVSSRAGHRVQTLKTLSYVSRARGMTKAAPDELRAARPVTARAPVPFSRQHSTPAASRRSVHQVPRLATPPGTARRAERTTSASPARGDPVTALDSGGVDALARSLLARLQPSISAFVSTQVEAAMRDHLPPAVPAVSATTASAFGDGTEAGDDGAAEL